MGPYYDIDDETGELMYQDASTNWELVRKQLTEGQEDRLMELVDAQNEQFQNLLKSFTREH